MAAIDPADDETLIQTVDPSWFVTPVERIETSGGTAPFFRLTLTEKGLEELASSNPKFKGVDKNFWIGKDLSHAEDEKDFYAQVLRIGSKRKKTREDTGAIDRDISEGVGALEPFMFDYLGILRTKSTENFSDDDDDDDDDDTYCNLLVMGNLRTNLNKFRMLDLKIGEKTACGGWKGKSHLRAMKHHFMDGFTNSASEGYRLCGFNGCPEVIKSMDPLLDVLSSDSINCGTKKKGKPMRKSIVEQYLEIQNMSQEFTMTESTAPQPLRRTSVFETILEHKGSVKDFVKTAWGTKVKETQMEQFQRTMFKKMNGTSVFRYFFDLHMDDQSSTLDQYLPVEVAEIVSHEFMSQLIRLSASCHKVKIPQKWIGSSVAVAYDAGFFPERSSEGGHQEEADIRSKVVSKIFDWGRSELLTADMYEALSPQEKADRHRFWNLYKEGVDRLSYNATRFYYNQFTTSTLWTDLIIEVKDFDSFSTDDSIGKVVIPLPDLSNTQAVEALGKVARYKLKGLLASTFGTTLDCKITWIDFPTSSRLLGAWRVTLVRATNVPPMDIVNLHKTSDAYCKITAKNAMEGGGQQFKQRTCIKARTRTPEWNETIDVPVCRTTNSSSLTSTFAANGIPSMDDKTMSDFFQWNAHGSPASRENIELWTNALKGKDVFNSRTSTTKWRNPLKGQDVFKSGTSMTRWRNPLKGGSKDRNKIFHWDKDLASKENPMTSKWGNPLKGKENDELFGGDRTEKTRSESPTDRSVSLIGEMIN